MKSLIMYFFCAIIIIDNINALTTQTELETQSQKFKHTNKKQYPRQNFNDASRFSPQPQQGYIPREVNSIYANKKPEIYDLTADNDNNKRKVNKEKKLSENNKENENNSEEDEEIDTKIHEVDIKETLEY